jgi:Holliday junction resolvase
LVKRKVALESAFQTKVINYLHSIGAYVIKIHVSSYQLEGEPDIICCHKGKFYAFELKQGSVLSDLQKIKLELIRESGGVAMEVRSIDQLKELFE